MKKSSDKLTKQTLSLYWGFLKKRKPWVAAVLFFIPLSSFVFRFLPPIFVANILGKMSSGNHVGGNLWSSFGFDLALYTLFTLVGGILLWRLSVFFIWQLEMRVEQDIDQTIFNRLIKQSSDFHANRFGGSLVSQANKFVSAYIRLQDTVAFQVIGTITSIVFAAGLLATSSPAIAGFVVIYSLVFAIFTIKLTRPIRRLNAKEASASNKRTGYLADAVTNIMAVKSFAHENYEIKRYGGATQRARDVKRELMWASLKKDSIFASFTTGISIFALVFALVGAVYFDTNVALVYLIITYIGIINQNLWDFCQSTLRNINRALGDAKEMTEILNIEPSVQDVDLPETYANKDGSIAFDGVFFQHKDGDDNETLFENFSLAIADGERVGLVGHSGSGKTTLTKLLLRFYDIDKGKITIGGQDISQIKQDDLHTAIAYVPQEPLLFHRTLAENIAYGRPSATLPEIKKAAKLAHAHEFIKDLPDSYDTLVGERGVKLSGGQRQRVAIARAILKDAPILVLDEATSALDSESEVLIQDALWKLMEGRTAIVIAHRLSTVQKMDRIIVLDDGKIIEEGTHKELLAQKSKYADLWNHQSGGFLEE